MFETAELGQRVTRQEHKQRLASLREALLLAQVRMRDARLPVVVLFSGVDGAGKGATANLLNAWLDPRWIVTRAYRERSQEEAERPPFWRYWRDLPPKGSMGLYLSAWYSRPLLDRAYERSTPGQFEAQLDEIIRFERTLCDDGALVLKFWMHLGRKAQEKRLRALEKDPLQAWRVTAQDWEHWRMYDKFISAAEAILQRTSNGHAPWILVEGVDSNYRSLRVGDELLRAIELRLDEEVRLREAAKLAVPPAIVIERGPHPDFDEATPGEVVAPAPVVAPSRPATILSTLDLSHKMNGKTFQTQLRTLQGQLNLLHRRLRELHVPVVMAFEGWDAAGKGGSIRRVLAAIDARAVRVHRVAAPSSEELAQHYLWRFWRKLPRAGEVAIFDRSWYGRVLVERIEGYAREGEWRRAYAEINLFEQQLVQYGTVLLKFWLHISPEEQLRRFELRRETSYKRWKLTEDDWRNRDKWGDYEQAVHDMVERTSARAAPWTLIEGEDKRYARIKILRETVRRWKQALIERGEALPPGLEPG